MATSAAPSDVTTQALVLHDPRPFLAQAIDCCLESGTWNVADLEVFTMDVVNMALRYLKHRQQDIRDLDAVGEAAEIVCMFIDDGLRMRSGNDLDRAATFLSADDQPLLKAFNQSWAALAQLRGEAQTFNGDLRDVLVGPPGHAIALHPIPVHLHDFGSNRGLEDYLDAALLAAWRKGSAVSDARERLKHGIARAERQFTLLKLLPFGGVTKHWNELLIADGTIGFSTEVVHGRAYDFGWASALIRAVERGDVGLVVTTAELAHFLESHLRSDDEGTFVSEEAVEAAAAVLMSSLGQALGQPADADVRHALAHAAGVIESTAKAARDDDIPPKTGQWFTVWATNAVFLAVNRKEHDCAVESIVGPMGQDELVERFVGTVVPITATEREEMLRKMDLAKMSVEDLSRVLEASPRHAEIILRRARLTQRPIDDIEALAASDVSLGQARHEVARAILASCDDLSRLSDNAVFALLLNLPPTPEALRTLLRKVRMTPERLLQAFREEDESDPRQEWVRLAVASPEYLVYLIGDIQETPRFARDVAAAFQGKIGDADCVCIPPGATASCFLEVEQAARRAPRQQGKAAAGQQGRRPFLDEHGEPQLFDQDLYWLWDCLPAHQQDAVRKTFRKADRSGGRTRTRTGPAKKPARKRKKTKRR